MSQRRKLAIVLFCFGQFAVVGVYGAGAMTDVGNPSAILRIPIPTASQRVDLEAKSYALYFGLLNAPTRVELHAPQLSITIVPPSGIPDPEFVEDHRNKPDRDHVSYAQVALIRVHQAGTYVVSVDSPEQRGGSFSIGDAPVSPPLGPAIFRGALVFVGVLLLALFVGYRRPSGPRDQGTSTV